MDGQHLGNRRGDAGDLQDQILRRLDLLTQLVTRNTALLCSLAKDGQHVVVGDDRKGGNPFVQGSSDFAGFTGRATDITGTDGLLDKALKAGISADGGVAVAISPRNADARKRAAVGTLNGIRDGANRSHPSTGAPQVDSSATSSSSHSRNPRPPRRSPHGAKAQQTSITKNSPLRGTSCRTTSSSPVDLRSTIPRPQLPRGNEPQHVPREHVDDGRGRVVPHAGLHGQRDKRQCVLRHIALRDRLNGIEHAPAALIANKES